MSVLWLGEGAGNASTLKLITAYTYSGNAVIQHTALDTTTDTFTATAHGLINGDVVFPSWNNENTSGYVYPTGMVQQIYYVVGATADTFQISTTSGGAALDITAAGSYSLKFHFEKAVVKNITISNLGLRNKIFVRALMFSSTEDKSYGYDIRPSEWAMNGDLIPNPAAGGNYNIGRTGAKGTAFDIFLDGSQKRKSVKVLYAAVYVDNSGASGGEARIGHNMSAANYPFSTLYVGHYGNPNNQYIANGTTLEVYEA